MEHWLEREIAHNNEITYHAVKLFAIHYNHTLNTLQAYIKHTKDKNLQDLLGVDVHFQAELADIFLIVPIALVTQINDLLGCWGLEKKRYLP